MDVLKKLVKISTRLQRLARVDVERGKLQQQGAQMVEQLKLPFEMLGYRVVPVITGPAADNGDTVARAHSRPMPPRPVPGRFPCPVKSCVRHRKPFRFKMHLANHEQSIHGRAAKGRKAA